MELVISVSLQIALIAFDWEPGVHHGNSEPCNAIHTNGNDLR